MSSSEGIEEEALPVRRSVESSVAVSKSAENHKQSAVQRPLHERILCQECQIFQAAPCWLHATCMSDEPVIPFAITSLPKTLTLETCSNSPTGKLVRAKEGIPLQTVFGPLVAPVSHEFHPSFLYAYPNLEGGGLLYYHLESEHFSNWLRYVRFAEVPDEVNLAVYLKESQVVFVSTTVILPGEELKVAYSTDYAATIGRGAVTNFEYPTEDGPPQKRSKQKEFIETWPHLAKLGVLDTSWCTLHVPDPEAARLMFTNGSIFELRQLFLSASIPISRLCQVVQNRAQGFQGVNYEAIRIKIERTVQKCTDLRRNRSGVTGARKLDEFIQKPFIHQARPVKQNQVADGDPAPVSTGMSLKSGLLLSPVSTHNLTVHNDSTNNRENSPELAETAPIPTEKLLPKCILPTFMDVDDVLDMPPPLPVDDADRQNMPPPLPIQRLFFCDQCHENFPAKYTLQMHLWSAHCPDRYRVCAVCFQRVNRARIAKHVCGNKSALQVSRK